MHCRLEGVPLGLSRDLHPTCHPVDPREPRDRGEQLCAGAELAILVHMFALTLVFYIAGIRQGPPLCAAEWV